MKKIISIGQYLILLMIVGVLFTGCQKDVLIMEDEHNDSGTINHLNKILSSAWNITEPDASIYINHSSGPNGFEEYKTKGYFYDGTSNQTCVNRVDAGDLILESLTLSKQGGSTCIHYSNPSDDLNMLYGSLLSINLTGGSGYSSGNTNLSIVEELKLSSVLATGSVPNFPNIEVVSKNNGHTITWNDDPNNVTGEIVVLLKYSDNLTQLVDPGLMANTYTHHIMTDDDGSYTITPQDLSTFPVNSYIELYVGRGSYKQWDNNGKMIDILAISKDNQDFVLTQ